MVSSLVELQDQFGGYGLQIVAIDVGEPVEVVREFSSEHGVNYLNLMANNEVLLAYGIRSHPLTVLVTPEGLIHAQQLGWSEKGVLEQKVQSLLGLSDQ